MTHTIRILGVAATAVLLATQSLSAAERPLRVGLDGTFAPHAMPKLGGGGVEGFNVDLANEIGRRLKRKMQITATQFSGLLPGLAAGTYDFIVAPTTVTAERAKNVLFTEGYLNTDYQFLVRKDAPNATKLADFKGKVISVNKGSAYHKWALGLIGKVGWKIQSYGTNTDAVQAVLAGRAYANVAGNTVIAWAAKKNPSLKLSYLHSTGRVFAMPFRKNDFAMRNKVEAIIECMKTDGTMAKMSQKWFGVTPKAGDAAVTVFAGYGVPGLRGHQPAKHAMKCN
ncbi:MAG TPA: transporter substrate-binding domain-containing protein [Alphaproteobacteria bacterium]|nr:transporter substrate-binding domain-containing protein [Alphaproteobacteria bacterium]